MAGTQGDGVFTLALGGVAALIAIAKRGSASFWVVACGVIGILITWSAMSGLESDQIAEGLYLTFIASVVVALAGIDAYRDGRKNRL